ncbi:hypothetical protein C0991_011581, partial [Blastosporella zonata]
MIFFRFKSFFKKSPSESGLDPLTGAVAILTTVVLQHFAGRATLPAQSGPAVARFLLPPPPPPSTLSLKALPTTTTMKVDQESLNCGHIVMLALVAVGCA